MGVAHWPFKQTNKYSPAPSISVTLMNFYFQGQTRQAVFHLFSVTFKDAESRKIEKQSMLTSPIQVNECLAPCVIMETLSTVLLQLDLFNPHGFGHHLAHFVVYTDTV